MTKKIIISRQLTDSGTSDLQYFTRTTNLEKLFGEVKSQTCELSEILGPRIPEIIVLKLMEYWDFTSRSMSLLSEKAERIITATVYVFSDSILCQGELNNPSTTKRCLEEEHWMVRVKKTEFEWRIFPRSTTIGTMEAIQKLMKSIQRENEEFEGRIIFMSMFNKIDWRQDDAKCILNSIEVSKYARRFPRGHLSLLEPGLAWAAISVFSVVAPFLSLSFAYSCHIALAQSPPKKMKSVREVQWLLNNSDGNKSCTFNNVTVPGSELTKCAAADDEGVRLRRERSCRSVRCLGRQGFLVLGVAESIKKLTASTLSQEQ